MVVEALPRAPGDRRAEMIREAKSGRGALPGRAREPL